MNHLTAIILVAAATAACPLAKAQDLSTEVVVDRTVAPEEKEAVRPSSLSPVLTLPPVEMPALDVARFTTLSPLTRSYARLDPAEGSLAATPSPWRGYAAIGYFPMLHGGLSAGYRILDTKAITLDAAVQADGARYKPVKRDPRDFKYYDIRAGINGSWRPDEHSSLGFKASYNMLNQASPLWEMQTVNYVKVGASWQSQAAGIAYNVHALGGFEMPGNTIIHRQAFNPSKDVLFYEPYQQRLRAGAGASYSIGGSSAVGLDLRADIIHSGNCVYDRRVMIAAGGTAGYIDLTPAYTYSAGALYVKAGVRLSYGTGKFSGEKFRVAPDVNIQWAPSGAVALWARADGGEFVMSNHDMRQYSPYQIFIYEARNANIPFRITAGADFTLTRGLTLGIGGGYAKADNWMMMSPSVPTFIPFDISGWNVRASLAYRHKWLSASVDGMFSPGDYSHAWLDNRDRARIVAGATLEVKPLAPLTAGVEYRGRINRNCYTYGNTSFSMGDICDLNVYASWRFNERVTVFGRCDNLLGHTYLTVAHVNSDKQTGAVGVEVKF